MLLNGRDRICRLKKTIYGLKQSLQAWFEKFSKVVVQGSFERCVVDHSVIYRKTTSDSVILTVYIDNILLTGSDSVGINETKEYLRTQFITKDMDKPRFFSEH